MNQAGTGSLANSLDGIYAAGGSFATSKIGGLTSDSLNVVSGNGSDGIDINSAANTRVIGNYVGVDATGNAAMANSSNGIKITSSNGCTIQGNVAGKNSNNGIMIISSQSMVIWSNFVGIGANGTTALGNSQQGVRLEGNCSSSTIGGTTGSYKNVISCNSGVGLYIESSTNCLIQGNHVGVDNTGNTAKGNGGQGIYLTATCSGSSIGGATTGLGNVVSGNTGSGIQISASLNCVLKGNIVGMGKNGTTAIGNGGNGITISGTSTGCTLGGTTSAERNLVSANTGSGISISSSNNCLITGNYVGVDATGLVCQGNTSVGIYLSSSSGCTIGGTNYNNRNITSCNGSDGISLSVACHSCIIKGNFIGVFVSGSGTSSTGNLGQGIFLLNTNSCTIGGTTHAERNVSSNNGNHTLGTSGDGIRIGNGSSNVLKGNYCGVDSTGLIAMPNEWSGISLNDCNGTTVGGTGSYERNVLSSNKNEGIYVSNTSTSLIYGNYIGVGVDGTTALGNEVYGINILGTSTDNTIGGRLSYANTIAYNYVSSGTAPGISIGGNAAARNNMTFNKVFCNGGSGFSIANTTQEGVAAPVVSSSLTNTVSGTAAANDSIHIYRNTTGGYGCGCEGEIFVGSTKADGAGNWTFTHNLGLSGTEATAVTATQNTAALSTSQFSSCTTTLPVKLILFNVYKVTSTSVKLDWVTASEENADYFLVLRSYDGVNFQEVGMIKAYGTTSVKQYYSFIDDDVEFNGTVYYQLKEVDLDYKYQFSPIRFINSNNLPFAFYEKQNGIYQLNYNFKAGEMCEFKLYTVEGKEVFSTVFMPKRDQFEYELEISGLSAGMYLVKMVLGTKVFNTRELICNR